MKILRFRSWNFPVHKLDESVRFYQEVLGGEVKVTHTAGSVEVARMQLGDSGLGLFDASREKPVGVPHYTFEIEGPPQPEELVRELEGKGVKVDEVRPHRSGTGYSVYVTDPNGNRLELSLGSG